MIPKIVRNFAPLKANTLGFQHPDYDNNKHKYSKMIIVQVKEGENIEKALKKFKRKFEKTGIVKEIRSRQAFEKPSVANRKKMMKAVYVQKLRLVEE